jgi:hypothetical protein
LELVLEDLKGKENGKENLCRKSFVPNDGEGFDRSVRRVWNPLNLLKSSQIAVRDVQKDSGSCKWLMTMLPRRRYSD